MLPGHPIPESRGLPPKVLPGSHPESQKYRCLDPRPADARLWPEGGTSHACVPRTVPVLSPKSPQSSLRARLGCPVGSGQPVQRDPSIRAGAPGGRRAAGSLTAQRLPGGRPPFPGAHSAVGPRVGADLGLDCWGHSATRPTDKATAEISCPRAPRAARAGGRAPTHRHLLPTRALPRTAHVGTTPRPPPCILRPKAGTGRVLQARGVCGGAHLGPSDLALRPYPVFTLGIPAVGSALWLGAGGLVSASESGSRTTCWSDGLAVGAPYS